MKIQCIDHKGSAPNTFLIKLRQNTILLNCPLEIMGLSGVADTRPAPATTSTGSSSMDDGGLASILSLCGGLDSRKQAVDVEYALSQSRLSSCDDNCVFRIADFSLVDVNSIDLVVISNSKLMLGLPFLTEYMGYKGKIFATEPTVEFARQRMEELVAYHGRATSSIEPGSATHFSRLGSLNQMGIPEGWRSLFTLKDIAACIEKIQPVRFTEHLSLFSTMRLVAHSSGYSLGSANWVIETSFRKIVLMSSSSVIPGLHPASFDKTILDHADVVLVSDVRPQNDDALAFERTKNRILTNTARALQAKQSVLFPISAMGIVFDLIGDLQTFLAGVGIELGSEPHQINMYFASPIADRSLQYANICGEWMTAEHQELLYVPQMPLPHGELLKNKSLLVIKSMESANLNGTGIREPCIVFATDHSCFQRGPLDWFMKRWGPSDRKLCILAEPDTPSSTAQELPANMRMPVLQLPLDTRLSLRDVGSALALVGPSSHPRHIVIPNMPESHLFKQEWQQRGAIVHIHDAGDILGIDLNRDWERVVISEKLAMDIRPSVLPSAKNSGSALTYYAPISGMLQVYNNAFELLPVTSAQDDALLSSRHLCDPIDLTTLLQKLRQHGVVDTAIKVTTDEQQRTIVQLLPPDLQATIILEGRDMTVVTSNSSVRELLRNVIAQNATTV